MNNEIFEFEPVIHSKCCACNECQKTDIHNLRTYLYNANRIENSYVKMPAIEWNDGKYPNNSRKQVTRAATALLAKGVIEDWCYQPLPKRFGKDKSFYLFVLPSKGGL